MLWPRVSARLPKGADHSMKSSLVPAVDWLGRYDRSWLRADVMAGLTTAAVVIPKAMAYATIAGLPVQIGLYTALVPMAVYAVLGSSRPLSVSTTTTLGILCAAALADAVPQAEPAALITASATLAVLTGAILLLARLLRLGFVANFISEPVLVGFKAGIGLVIVLDQAPKLLGLHYDKARLDPRRSARSSAICPKPSTTTLVVGFATLAIVVGLEHLGPAAARAAARGRRRRRGVAAPRARSVRRRRSSDTSRAACPRSSDRTCRSSSCFGPRPWRSRS